MRPIDADALLRTIESIEQGNAELIEFYLETKVLLGNAPTIEAEPVRHGRCDYCKDGKSFIGQTVILANDGELYSIWYCPHCGAKMGVR